MLKIREAQFDALAAAQFRDAHQVIANWVWRQREDFSGEFDTDYVDRLVVIAIDQCRKLGVHQLASWIGFTESLFKDDLHPLSASRILRKTEGILAELAAQSLFSSLKALEASSAASSLSKPSSDH